MSTYLVPVSPIPTPAAADSTDVTVTRLMSHPDPDATLLQLWLHGRSSATQDAYRRDVARFLQFAQHPLAHVTLGHLQAFADHLEAADLAPASRKRMLSAVKSLYSFAERIGALQYNVGAAVILPKSKNTIGERILTEAEVQQLIEGEPDGRNRLLLVLLYATGARVSEICRLCWRDCQPQKKGGQVTLYGKGQKTRHVLLKAETFVELLAQRGAAALEVPVFRSNAGGALSRQQVFRIVKAAAIRAGLSEDVSPHWLRHAHASHALDRGAPPHLVQATLGHASLDTTSRYAHARPTDSSARYLAL